MGSHRFGIGFSLCLWLALVALPAGWAILSENGYAALVDCMIGLFAPK